MKTHTPIAALMAALITALVFTACDFLTGADGPEGIPGTNGLPGGAGVMVYDSSSPPKLLGYLLSVPVGGLDFSPYVLSPTGYVVQYSEDGPVKPSYICFTLPGQSGDPCNFSSFAKSVFYNPHSGGRFYTFTSAYPADTTTGFQSAYDAGGNPDSTTSSGTFYKLNPGVPDNPANRAAFGIPAGTITRPLQYSTAELE
jgi:hypothetical protein